MQIIKKNIPNLLKENAIVGKSLLTGVSTGVPIIIYEEIFTRLHFNEHILTKNIEFVELTFLLGFFAYGYDRFRDVIDAGEYEGMEVQDNIKFKLFEKYKNTIILIYGFAFLEINRILYEHPLNYVFSVPLYSCIIYKDLKPYLGIYKPLFIAIMWTGASIIIPSVMIENSFDIFNDPLCYVPSILSLWSASSIADIKDLEQDRKDSIETIPVKYGLYNTKMFSMIGILISSILFGIHENYGSLGDSLFEIQNALISFAIYFNNRELNSQQ